MKIAKVSTFTTRQEGYFSSFYSTYSSRLKFKFKIYCTHLGNHPVLDIFLPYFSWVLVVMLFQTPVTPGVHSPQVFLKDKKKKALIILFGHVAASEFFHSASMQTLRNKSSFRILRG